MFNNNSNDELKDPPIYDTLTVRFRGDNHDVILPYCEVANGDIVYIGGDLVKIEAGDNKKNALSMSFADFAKLVEQSFDIKDITKLSVQLAGAYEEIEIL